MGNIRNVDSFEELWFSKQAEKVRSMVRSCRKNCWMVGTAAPVMKKYISHPAKWVVKNKLKSLLGISISSDDIFWHDVGQDPAQGNRKVVGALIPSKTLTAGDELSPEERKQIINEIEETQV